MYGFIKAVQQHRCLWDIHNRHYRNHDKKDMAWSAIAKLKIKGIRNSSDARAEWKKLRDNHRDSLKRMKSKKNKWKYGAAMQFLVKYMTHRKKRRRTGSLSISNDQQSTQTDEQQFDENNKDFIEVSVPDDYCTKDDFEADVDPIETRKRKWEDEREKGRGMRYLQPTKHPMDLFMDSMAKRIKRMPQWMQIRVRRQIFAAVSDAEDTLQLCVPEPAPARAELTTND